MARREELTEEQWTIIQPLIPTPPSRADRRGRPWRYAREVLNGILWIPRSGARGQDLPERFPPYQPGHRRFRKGGEPAVTPSLHLVNRLDSGKLFVLIVRGRLGCSTPCFDCDKSVCDIQIQPDGYEERPRGPCRRLSNLAASDVG